MKKRLAGVTLVVCAGLGLWLWSGAAPAAGPVDPAGEAVAAMSLTVFTADEEPKYSYVGSQTCKKCHLAQHKSWAKTKMGEAFESLKIGKAAEVKEKFGLDPKKDYTKDAACLPCHTVGYQKPGGYAPPDPEDRRAVKRAESLRGVGCESCHGPGSEYVKVFEEIDKSQRTYTTEELTAVGLRLPDKTVCVECHNADSPTVDPTVEFDFEGTKDKSTHEHKPLKLREG
jgi:formate-dependent nitrite reductase cytochrome c552 subunit